MKTNRTKAGFNLIELIVVISVVAVLAVAAWAGYGVWMERKFAKQVASQACDIHKWCVAYALDGGGAIPVGESSSNDLSPDMGCRT